MKINEQSSGETIKIAIIEDEPAIRNEISFLVEQEPDTEILGWSDNVNDAVQLLDNLQPEVVLMDIQLLNGSAFDVLNQVKKIPENIIFITAYNQFAIKAIKFGALDYLLKPVDKEELQEALQRFRKKNGKENNWQNQLSIAQENFYSENLPENIALHSLNSVTIVLVKDIIYCKGDGPYTSFHLRNGDKIMVSKPLKYYEELLPPPYFLRSHQSYLINRDSVEKISKSEHLILKNKEEIPVSSRRKHYILNALLSIKNEKELPSFSLHFIHHIFMQKTGKQRPNSA